jgi:hypothetical protein
MTPEPRNESDYSQRQMMAARRVFVDEGQMLASFVDCLVVVGRRLRHLFRSRCRHR